MTVYTATTEMCHTGQAYGGHRLPFDWPGRKFTINEHGNAVILEGEVGVGETRRIWNIDADLLATIRDSVPTRTVYTATEEMCHTTVNYGQDLLPFDWPRKKFTLRPGSNTAILEDGEDSPTRDWTISYSLRGIIEASVATEEPDTVPRETHEATLKDRDTTISDLRDTVIELRDTVSRQTMKHEGFKKQVVAVAMEYGERHDWCDAVSQALEEMGLEASGKEYSFTLSVVYRVTGTKETWGEPDAYDIQSRLNVDPGDLRLSLENWGEFDIEVADYDVMDVEEQE